MVNFQGQGFGFLTYASNHGIYQSHQWK